MRLSVTVTAWAEPHSCRWDWVDGPIATFRAGCDPSLGLAHHLDSSDREFNAVLFGRTQTGKTTLMLRLLGIADDQLETVSSLLRGGRSVGQSATALPTRYQWSSEDAAWQFRVVTSENVTSPPQPLDDRQFLARMAELRSRSGVPKEMAGIVEVGIPRRYRLDQETLVYPRILDLPGAEADTDAERQWAELLIRRHVPAAHVVVMVVRADAIATALTSGLAASMPQLAMWTEVPERFRIVVTRVYSSDSVRRKLARGSAFSTADDIRRHMFDQLTTGDLVLPEGGELRSRIREAIYPVEYGRTWKVLRDHDPDAFRLAEPLVGQELERLSHSLTSIEAESTRRIGMVRAASTVKAVTERKFRAEQAELKRVEAEVARAREQLAQLDGAERRAMANLERSRELRAQYNAAASGPRPPVNRLWSYQEETGPETRALGREHSESLRKAWIKAWNDWQGSDAVRQLCRETGHNPRLPQLVGVFEEEWGCASICGHKCTSERIVFWREKPAHCHGRQSQANAEAATRFSALCRGAVSDWSALVTRDLEARWPVQSNERKLTQVQEMLLHQHNLVLSLESQVGSHEKALVEMKASSEEAIQLAERLGQQLRLSLLGEIARHESQGGRAESHDARLAAGLAIALTLADAERLGILPAKRPPSHDDGAIRVDEQEFEGELSWKRSGLLSKRRFGLLSKA